MRNQRNWPTSFSDDISSPPYGTQGVEDVFNVSEAPTCLSHSRRACFGEDRETLCRCRSPSSHASLPPGAAQEEQEQERYRGQRQLPAHESYLDLFVLGFDLHQVRIDDVLDVYSGWRHRLRPLNFDHLIIHDARVGIRIARQGRAEHARDFGVIHARHAFGQSIEAAERSSWRAMLSSMVLSPWLRYRINDMAKLSQLDRR